MSGGKQGSPRPRRAQRLASGLLGSLLVAPWGVAGAEAYAEEASAAATSATAEDAAPAAGCEARPNEKSIVAARKADEKGLIVATDGADDSLEPIATVSADDSIADFASGLIASTIGSTGSLKGALDAASFEVGTAYLPDGPAGGGTPTGGTGLAISSSSTPEEQLAAAMFLAFLTDTENTATFSQATGYMPVRTSAALLGHTPGTCVPQLRQLPSGVSR